MQLQKSVVDVVDALKCEAEQVNNETARQRCRRCWPRCHELGVVNVRCGVQASARADALLSEC